MPRIIDSFENPPDLPHDERISTERPFDGHLLKLRVDTVRQPSGKESIRELVEHPGSACIIPVTTDGKVLLIRQFRYATNEYLLEIPAGLIDEGEEPIATAKRELIEETGYEAGSIRELCTVYISPGYSEEVTTIFLAGNCTPIEDEHEDNEDEPIQMLYLPLSDIPALLTEGESKVGDAQTMLGLLWLVRLGMA